MAFNDGFAGLPQPNLPLIADKIDQVAAEIRLFPNIPSFQNAGNIMQMLQQMEENATHRFEALELHVTEIANQREVASIRRFETLELHLAASNHNSIARLANTHVHFTGEILTQLHNKRNEEIDNFPRTVTGITHMRAEHLSYVLEELGASTTGSIHDRQKMLRLVIGLRNDVP